MAIDVPDELRSFLRSEAQRASDTALDEARAVAIRAYQGDKYGDEEEGRSQAVTRDVSEVVDTMLVGILGTIMAGGKAVEFDTEPEEVQEQGEDGQPATRRVDYGAEATAAVHYQFMRRQKGYRILHDAGKAGMLEKTGIVKTYVEPRAPVMVQRTALVDEIERGEDGDTIDGMPIVGVADDDGFSPIINVTVAQPQAPLVRDKAIPNEWFLVAPDTVDLDESVYVGDKAPVSISELVGMGYDHDELLTIWDGSNAETVVEKARDADRSSTRDSIGRRVGPARQLWLHEEYPLYDLNGDGIAERLFVHRIGFHVLRVMEVDEQPYSGWSPIPMQHRFTGQSIADKIMDIQRIRSVLLRQGLDSLYQTTAPRMTLSESSIGDDTIDDLLTVRPGALIRYKGNLAPMPLAVSDSSPTSFQAMEMMSAERESRTGVTRQSQGLNPDTTNKTARGMAMLQENSDQIELYVTRNMAEMLVAPMFAKRYQLMRQHVQPFRMKIEGKYTLVDPSKWPDEPDMQINVGLGTGSREQRIAYRRELIGMQAEAQGAGLRIVDEAKLFNSAKAFVDDTSLGVATDFFNDPSQLPPAEPKTDPAAIEAQGKAQTEQQKVAAEVEKAERADQLKAAQLEVDREVKLADVDAKAGVQRWEAEQRIGREDARANAEAELAVRRLNFDMALAERRAEFDMQLAEKRANASDDEGGLPKYRPGGDLDK